MDLHRIKGSWRVWLAAGVCVGGVALMVVVWRNHAPRPSQPVAAPTATDPMPPVQNPTRLADTPEGELPAQFAVAIRDELFTLGLPQSEQLVGDAQTVLSAWLSGDASEYLAYLEQAGHGPPDAPVWRDREAAQRAFASSTATLRKAAFDPAGVAMRPQFVQGNPVVSEERHARSWGSRFDKLEAIRTDAATFEEIEAARLDVHEIRMPIRLDGEVSKEPFDGMLGLSYAWDSHHRRWTLVAVSIYGVPNGDAVRLPPF